MKLLMKQVCNPLNSQIPYSDLKLAVTLFIRNKWEREWDEQAENNLKEKKSCIAF